MTKIEQFDNAVKEKQAEIDRLNYADASTPIILSDDERKELEDLKKDQNKAVVVKDSLSSVSSTDIPLDEYLQMVDDNIPRLKSDGMRLASMNVAPEFAPYVDNMRNVTKQSIKALQKSSLSKMDYMEVRSLISRTINTLKTKMSLKNGTLDSIVPKLKNMSPEDVIKAVPSEFISSYVPRNIIQTNREAAKNYIINIVNMMVNNSRTDEDDFEKYIESQSRLLMVLEDINEENAKVAQFIQSKETFTEFAKRAIASMDDRSRRVTTYIKTSDNIKLRFIQYSNVNNEFAKAYRNIRDKYTDPKELEIIDNEIKDAEARSELYLSVLDLVKFTEVFNLFEREFFNNKNVSRTALSKIAKTNLERIYKSKANNPFPGYKGNENNVHMIYINYLNHIRFHAEAYNKCVVSVNEKEDEKLTPISNIDIFADVILIIMGRLEKSLLKNTGTLHDKLENHIYFELFCRVCSDLFITDKIVTLTDNFVKSVENL